MTDADTQKALGGHPPRDLADARLQLHWAAQVAAGLSNALLEKQPDDGQDNFGWDEESQALLGRPLAAGLRSGIHLQDGRLVLFRGVTLVGSVHLQGRTLDQVRHRFEELARKLLPSQDLLAPDALVLRGYPMPDHPVSSGKPFDLDLEACAEIARWFSHGAAALEGLGSHNEGASSVRCWPHHFDLGMLITLDPEKDPETARSIGAGLSPGDETFAQPYFYVSPYPRPENRELPDPPPPGHWHREGFLAAVLTGTNLVEEAGLLADGDDHRETTDRFLAGAVAVARKLLEQ